MQRLMLECAVRAALIALGTAAALGLVRVKSAGARHAAWTAVLALMLALPVWMAWGPRLSMPLLPARQPVTIVPVVFTMPAPLTTVQSHLAPRRADWNWLAMVYGAGVLVLLARLVFGTLRARALVRRATVRAGYLTSSACAAPVTVGWLKPVMILPQGWSAWPAGQLDAVVAHESAHIRCRDPLVQWLALLNRAIFWFHPLAWWLERRLSELAEEACDAAVLAGGFDARAYSGYLLEMARSVGHTGARVRLVGMAMPGGGLPDRIGKILANRPAPRVSRARALALVIACGSLSALFGAANLDREPFVASPPLPAAPPSAPISKAELPEQDPQQPVEGRLIALYFDLDGAIPAIQAQSDATAIAIVQQHTNSNDRMAIIQWRGGVVKTLEDFTSDHARLIATIQKLVSNPDADPGGPNGLLGAVKMLGALKEKKSLIYFAMPPLRVSASPDEVRTIVGAAQAANVALFPIDVTGFTAGAQVGDPIRVGDVLTLTLDFHRVFRRGEHVILRADARAEYERIDAPFAGHTFTVERDGMVSVPGLGDVQAAGLTIAQLESTLGPALAARLSTPKFPIRGVTVEKH